MPCTDGREPYNFISYESLQETKNRLDTVTRLLCGILQHTMDSSDIGESHIRSKYGVETWDWWVKHQEDDKIRIDKLRAAALSKLTAAEREALGL